MMKSICLKFRENCYKKYTPILIVNTWSVNKGLPIFVFGCEIKSSLRLHLEWQMYIKSIKNIYNRTSKICKMDLCKMDLCKMDLCKIIFGYKTEVKQLDNIQNWLKIKVASETEVFGVLSYWYWSNRYILITEKAKEINNNKHRNCIRICYSKCNF